MHPQPIQVNCTGLAKSDRPDPCSTVIFGASGDLCRTKLVPSLFALFKQGLLPRPFALIGNGRRPWSDEVFRQTMRAEAAKEKIFCPDAWAEFSRSLSYVAGDVNDDATYAKLGKQLAARLAELNLPGNVLFHLSTAPEFYADIVEGASRAKLFEENAGWRRVIIEKPFGQDEASARALDKRLYACLRSDQLYHIDHYLGKETVQNMLAYRFANPAFESIWNRDFIDHVQITAAEERGIGARAGYFEGIGVIRDMIQNHLLQVLSLVAMEPAFRYDEHSLRDETYKVLQAIAPPDLSRDCVVGQYAAAELNGQRVPGYRDEQDVPAGSTTPTFAAVKLHVANWRWAGVPFYLRTGKRLARKVTEISIRFRPTPHLMFPLKNGETLPANTLTFRLQPDEGIVQTFQAKQPGPGLCLRQVTMDFAYHEAFHIDRLPESYEWLLLDAMYGDPTLFPRSDWIYRAWQLVDPWLRQADAAKDINLYPAGAWGPQAAHDLLKRDGRAWTT